MVLTGYPVEDLALRPSFQDASRAALDRARAAARSTRASATSPWWSATSTAPRGADERLGRPRGGPQNAAAVLHGGGVVARYAKHHLPNYGVFDEFRYFVPGEGPTVVRVDGVDVAIAICEDLWQDGGPVAEVRGTGAGLLLVVNGSPYERNKDDVRLALCHRRAREAGCALAYVNMVGGQDELVFDGDSLVVDAEGAVVARAEQFAETAARRRPRPPGGRRRQHAPQRCSAAHGRPYAPVPSTVAPRIGDDAEVWAALVTGLRDYVGKNGFRSVTLGLSGGIDSAVVAAIAVDALGADNVHGVSLPSAYSSEHSKGDAYDLAERTGLPRPHGAHRAHGRRVPVAALADAGSPRRTCRRGCAA